MYIQQIKESNIALSLAFVPEDLPEFRICVYCYGGSYTCICLCVCSAFVCVCVCVWVRCVCVCVCVSTRTYVYIVL